MMDKDLAEITAHNDKLLSEIDLKPYGDIVADAAKIFYVNETRQCWSYQNVGNMILTELGFIPISACGDALFVMSDDEPHGICYSEPDNNKSHAWLTLGHYVVDFSAHEQKKNYDAQGGNKCQFEFDNVIIQRYDTMPPISLILEGMHDYGIGTVSYDMNVDGMADINSYNFYFTWKEHDKRFFEFVMNKVVKGDI